MYEGRIDRSGCSEPYIYDVSCSCGWVSKEVFVSESNAEWWLDLHQREHGSVGKSG